MNITNEQAVMIFKREYQGNTFYSLGLSKKKQDGTYDNGYMPCQFKKGVSIEDKTKIYLKHAWLSFYLKDIPDSTSKQTVPYIFINEFETLKQTIENSKSNSEILKDVMEDKDPFVEFGNSIEIDDNFLE